MSRRCSTITNGEALPAGDAHFASSDVYIFHFPGLYPLLETIRRIRRGAVIFYHHNVTPPELWGAPYERELLQRSREAIKELIVHADLIVTPSPFNAEELIAEHAADVHRVRVLPLAVSQQQFVPRRADSQLVRQHGLDGRKVILYVGRMAGNKRIDLLIDALPEVQRMVPNATLLLVGDDASSPAFVELVAAAKRRADALDVTKSVTFTGMVPDVAPTTTWPMSTQQRVFTKASAYRSSRRWRAGFPSSPVTPRRMRG